MKNIIIIFAFLFSVSLSSQDKAYWMCFNFAVEKQSEATELVEAVEMLMTADEMSQNPFTVFLVETAFANSKTDFTHQLCFLSPNAELLKFWGQGPGEFAESKLVNKIFENVATPVSSVLASPVIFDPNKAGYEYSNIWSLKVDDIPNFAKLASDFIRANSTNFDGVIELHEAISGQEEGVTHYMIARSNNLGEWLMGREAVFANPDSQPWFKNASKYSSTISSFGSTTLKVYSPE